MTLHADKYGVKVELGCCDRHFFLLMKLSDSTDCSYQGFKIGGQDGSDVNCSSQ